MNNSTSTTSYPKTKLALMSLLISGALFGCSPQNEDRNNDSIIDETTAAQTTESTATNYGENSSSETAQTAGKVTVDTARGPVEMNINPNPIAVYDMTLLQDLAALEVPVQGMPTNLHLDNLEAAGATDNVKVGTVFEPDMETLNQLQPQAILVGSRMAEKFDSLSSMAPTLDMTIDTANIYQSSMQRLSDLGKLFNKQDKAEQLQKDIDDAIAKAKAASEGKGNGLVILVNGNKISAYGKDSRYGFLHNDFGIPAADTNIKEARHGQPISFEYLQKTDPDWLFVLDRTSAIGQEGVGAEEVLDNPLIHETKAWKNQHIVYLSPDSYLAFGGYYQWLTDAQTIIDNLGKAKKVAS